MSDTSIGFIENTNKNLVEISVSKHLDVILSLNGCLLITIVIGIVLYLIYRIFYSNVSTHFEIDEAELGIGDQKITLKPNHIDSQVAYKIWVELSTRKIGIPVDLEKDVIAEVYNSWYKFFEVTRELIKEVPVQKLKRKETENIVKVSIDVLNNGVRPHLTKWQAKFRRWYDHQVGLEDMRNLSPQEIQKRFNEYDELSKDLLAVNRRLIKYREAMYKLAIGKH